jgi:hypothetical protein
MVVESMEMTGMAATGLVLVGGGGATVTVSGLDVADV